MKTRRELIIEELLTWAASGDDEMTRCMNNAAAILEAPIPMRLPCPACHELPVDEGEFAQKPHHTHACQACGNVWRPAIVPTVGVRFLPGFKGSAT
jgi:hypothetical protein